MLLRGLVNFKVKFVGNAGFQKVNFSSIFVHAASTNNCSINLNVALANAINLAYSSTINLWNANQLTTINGATNLNATFLKELNKKFRIEINQCAPDYSVIFSLIKLISQSDRFKMNFNHGTIWQNTMNDFINNCQ